MFDIKGLVNSLFQSNAQEGVFDLKSATIFMDELPESDILQAQIEIVKALKQLNNTPKINMGERFKTIPYLEEKAQPLQNHLLDIYHGRLIEEGTSPHQVLPTILSFWHEMATGYLGCIKQINRKKFALIQEKKVELFTLRAMELYAIQAQYSYMRHLEIDHQIWRNLNRLYHFAEQSNFTNKPLNTENTSIQRCYIQALMLSLSNPENLQSTQIELIAIWLQKWSAEIKLETLLQPQQHLFAINLTGTSAPKRIRRDMVGENWRYWSAAPITEQIQNLLTQLKGESPHHLDLPAETASPANLEQLQILNTLWSRDAETPVRKHERQNNNQSIRVIIGTQNIEHYMAQQGKISSNGDHISTEKWELGNESASGFGLNYHSETQLEVGELLGLANIGQHPFTIGIVRRFNRSQKGFVSVGVETLTQSPMLIELAPFAQNSIQCIYAPEGPSVNPARLLIIPNEVFSENEEYKFTAQNKSYRIRLSPALEHTPSFVLAKFTVLEKIEASTST
jgi:cyclic-di-GMP-binding protein